MVVVASIVGLLRWDRKPDVGGPLLFVLVVRAIWCWITLKHDVDIKFLNLRIYMLFCLSHYEIVGMFGIYSTAKRFGKIVVIEFPRYCFGANYELFEFLK